MSSQPETTAMAVEQAIRQAKEDARWAHEPQPVECDLCGWKGRRIGARSRPCPNCGSGKVQFRD